MTDTADPDASLDTPNCPQHLTPMEVAGTIDDPEWWCAECAYGL